MKIFGFVLLNILLLLVVCVIFCLFAKMCLHISFSKHPGKDLSYEIKWTLFGGKFKKTLKLNKSSKDKKKPSKKSEPEKKQTLTEKLGAFNDTLGTIKKIYSKSSSKLRKSAFIQKIHLRLRFGVDDAFITGTLTGLIWATIYNLVAIVSRFFRVTEPDFEIIPVYDEETFDAEGECILSFRLVNIISALISVGIIYLKIKPKHKKTKIASENHKRKGGD